MERIETWYHYSMMMRGLGGGKGFWIIHDIVLGQRFNIRDNQYLMFYWDNQYRTTIETPYYSTGTRTVMQYFIMWWRGGAIYGIQTGKNKKTGGQSVCCIIRGQSQYSYYYRDRHYVVFNEDNHNICTSVSVPGQLKFNGIVLWGQTL